MNGWGRGSRIPAALWNDAAGVARVRGVYATARALRLNYEGLKTRLAAVADAGASTSRAERGVRRAASGSAGGGWDGRAEHWGQVLPCLSRMIRHPTSYTPGRPAARRPPFGRG